MADSPSFCYVKLTILHLAEEGGRRSISCSSGHNEARALSWQRVQIYVGGGRSVHPRHRIKGFNNEKCVCATTSYMQLLLPVSAVVTIEMGSRLTASCQCLATVLSPLNWQLFPRFWLLFAIHLQHTQSLGVGRDSCGVQVRVRVHARGGGGVI